MLVIKGADFHKVELPELKDSVYFGQEKTFSEAQYERSPTLKKEIQRGRLIIISRTQEDFAEFKAPPVQKGAPELAAPVAVQAPEPVAVPAELLEEIEKLRDTVKDLQDSKQEEKVPEVPSALAERVEEIASTLKEMRSIKEVSAPAGDAGLAKSLEDISKQISGLHAITGDGNGNGNVTTQQNTVDVKEEVYVPDVSITDMSNNVKLETRSLGQGGKVNDALAALKNMKKSNKST